MFRNVGIQNSDAGELPRRKHTKSFDVLSVTLISECVLRLYITATSVLLLITSTVLFVLKLIKAIIALKKNIL